MRLLLDVYDAAWNRLGDGPVTTLTGARVVRMLDGVGTITFDTPATDQRALTLLTTRRRFKLFTDYGGVLREVGRGIILRRTLNETESSGAMFSFECADILAELKDANTLIGRKYSQQTIGTIVSSLIGLASGWSATVESPTAALVVDARFDGVPVLTALLELCKNNGVHLRLAASGKTVEIGAFGAASTMRAMNVEFASPTVYADATIAPISGISAGDDAEDVVNWIVPLGGGEDAASLKLRRSTRTTPYTIQTMTGPNGRPVWYLSDAASITAYGQSQRVIKFDGIKPLSNSTADRVNAANALYDAAVAYLQRMKEPVKSYGLSLTGVKANLMPGDKLAVRYEGLVMREGVAVDYASINESMWMMEVGESFGLEGASVDLQVSNIDRAAGDVAATIVEALEDISLRGLSPQAGVSTRTYVYQREIASGGFHCNVPVEFSDATLELLRVRVRLKTTPFRATSVQGDHRHLMATRIAFGPVSLTNAVQIGVVGNAAGSVPISSLYLPASADPANDIYTFGAAGAVEYGIVDDTVTPQTVQCWVNGTNRTSALGGPWAVAPGTELDLVLDVGLMTDYLENAAGGLYQEHRIQFRCTGGRGRCEVTVEIYEVVQTIDV